MEYGSSYSVYSVDWRKKNTPGIIRYPFERIAARYSRTKLVRMNRDYPESELSKKCFLSFTEDISMILNRLTPGLDDRSSKEIHTLLPNS
jgi:hypothetical protein